MKTKLAVFCLPVFAGCGGVVDLGPVEQDAPAVEFEQTLVQFAPWSRGMCGLFSDESIRCWRNNQHDARALPNLTGVAINVGDQYPSRLCAVQRSGRVACALDNCGHRYADDDDPNGCGFGYSEPYELYGLEGALRVTKEPPGLALLADGRIQYFYEPFRSCAESTWEDPYCRQVAEPFEADEPIVDAFGLGDFVTASGAAYSTTIHHKPAVIERVIVPNDFRVHDFPPLRVPGVDDALQIKGDYVLHRSGAITAFAWVDCRGPGSHVAAEGSARVECLDDAVALESNGQGTCAIRTDGSLWCWGTSIVGELGVIEKVPNANPPFYADYTAVVDAPYRIPDVENVRAVAIGHGYTCAVRGRNEVSCWGAHGMSKEPSTTPRPIRFQ
ncbi:MAG TPA: hypothetical protein VFZ53_29415 [Polyangiaceae bacterium]